MNVYHMRHERLRWQITGNILLMYRARFKRIIYQTQTPNKDDIIEIYVQFLHILPVCDADGRSD